MSISLNSYSLPTFCSVAKIASQGLLKTGSFALNTTSAVAKGSFQLFTGTISAFSIPKNLPTGLASGVGGWYSKQVARTYLPNIISNAFIRSAERAFGPYCGKMIGYAVAPMVTPALTQVASIAVGLSAYALLTGMGNGISYLCSKSSTDAKVQKTANEALEVVA
ncbi:MAG: hypothetical protein BGO14_09850 [Chlamydiales bacterium 38-26]|nr:hypothetical protein [Chlamydiales bacterium]OJV11272.1 MAG: hypothetical protein BGO14_09850 [Chlamydiales bacterium 38-26]